MMPNPHIVFFLCPGLGHVTPFLRLAAMAAARNCTVTLIDTNPSVSADDTAKISVFVSNYREINRFELKLDLVDNSSTMHDAFMNQYAAITRSLHLLPPLLSSLPQPISAIFSEFAVASSLTRVTANLGIPIYIVSATSARSYSTVAFLPFGSNDVMINVSNPILEEYLVPNARSLSKVNGVILNSFDWFETRTIEALGDIPKIYPLGPLEPHKLEREFHLPWLDDHPVDSVVFVSFGNRLELSRNQTREVGKGLKRSGYSFVWALGDDENGEILELLGESFLAEVTEKGVMVKRGVNHAAVLAHPAIGGFVNLCEWDFVIDAAREGVPILAWPVYGTQRMNAEVVVNAGLGVMVKEWGWDGERLIVDEEIGKSVRELMGDEELRMKAKKVGEEARKACEIGGSSEKVLTQVIEMLRKIG